LLTNRVHLPRHDTALIRRHMKRLECLDGLRGVLAVYVLLSHMAPFADLPAWVQWPVSHGAAAVHLFFALSGLVIVQSLDRAGARAGPFLAARAGRIFPVFLPVFAFAVAVEPLSCGFDAMPWLSWTSPAHSICVSGWPRAWAPEIAAHLTMTHGLYPEAILPDVWISFLGSAWSLSAEWQFYVLALLVPRRRLLTILLLLAAAGTAWRLVGPDPWQFSRAFLPNQAHYFALGVASAGVVRRQPGSILRYAGVACAALAVAASTGAAGKMIPPLAWTACLLMQLAPSFRLLRIGRSALASPICLWLGALSYCIYLVNEPIHKVIGVTLAGLAHGDAALFTLIWIPAAIGVPILVSAALHAWLEQPALTWVRRAVHRENSEVQSK
jgi:peptidoglycan/LPS O-acetylase OafA/YrhL